MTTCSCVLGVALSLSGCVDDGGPRLETAAPAAAARNALVTLVGTRLCGPQGDCTTAAGEVLIGIELPQVRATVVMYADDSAQIRIPSVAPIGVTNLVVTVDDRSSNAIGFEVLP